MSRDSSTTTETVAILARKAPLSDAGLHRVGFPSQAVATPEIHPWLVRPSRRDSVVIAAS
jgi:hypothetical protein